MAEPKDKALYEKAKNKYSSMKSSAYKSGLIVKHYKELYKAKYKNDDAYVGKKESNKGLSRWFKEDWKNQRGNIGYEKKGDIYRPTKKVTKDTPKTYKELSKADINNAMKEKKQSGRVKKY